MEGYSCVRPLVVMIFSALKAHQSKGGQLSPSPLTLKLVKLLKSIWLCITGHPNGRSGTIQNQHWAHKINGGFN